MWNVSLAGCICNINNSHIHVPERLSLYAITAPHPDRWIPVRHVLLIIVAIPLKGIEILPEGISMLGIVEPKREKSSYEHFE